MTIASVRVMKVFRLSCRHQVASAERNIEEFRLPVNSVVDRKGALASAKLPRDYMSLVLVSPSRNCRDYRKVEQYEVR